MRESRLSKTDKNPLKNITWPESSPDPGIHTTNKESDNTEIISSRQIPVFDEDSYLSSRLSDSTLTPFHILGRDSERVNQLYDKVRGKSIEELWARLESYNRWFEAIISKSIEKSADADELGTTDTTVYLAQTPKGFFNSDITLDWFHDVVLPEKKSRDPNRPFILIMDCCSCHRTLKVREFCVQHNIVIFFIPGNCIALIQPLDCCFNANYKKAMRGYGSTWIDNYFKAKSTDNSVTPAYSVRLSIEMALRSARDITKRVVVKSFSEALSTKRLRAHNKDARK